MIKLYVQAKTMNSSYTWDGHRKTCKIRIRDASGTQYSEGEFVLPITSTSLTVTHHSGEVEYKVILTISGDARTYTVTNIQMYYNGSIVSTYTPDTLNVFVIPTPGTYGVSNSVVKRIIFNGKEVYMTKCNKNPENENYVWAKPYTLTINNINCSLYGSEVAPARVEEIGGIKEPGDYFTGKWPSLWGQDTNYFTIYHGEVYYMDELVLAESGEPGTPIDSHEASNQLLNVVRLATIGPVNGSITYSATCTGDPGGSGGGTTYKAPKLSKSLYYIHIYNPNTVALNYKVTWPSGATATGTVAGGYETTTSLRAEASVSVYLYDSSGSSPTTTLTL